MRLLRVSRTHWDVGPVFRNALRCVEGWLAVAVDENYVEGTGMSAQARLLSPGAACGTAKPQPWHVRRYLAITLQAYCFRARCQQRGGPLCGAPESYLQSCNG